MSRSGYNDWCDNNWNLICWRGAVASAVRGKRGQAFLREMLEALDDLPEKRLIAHEFEEGGEVCALGAVARKRGIPMKGIDPEDSEQVAAVFGVAHAMTCEIMFENDEVGMYWKDDAPEHRFNRVRAWVVSNLK